jgi:hypothetical protein
MTQDLNKCRPLDVHRWSDHSEVNDFIQTIYEALEGVTKLSNIDKKLIKVVVLDLFVLWKNDPSMVLMFSRDNNAYKAKSRYSSLYIGKKVITLIDRLKVCGLVHQKIGFQDRATGSAFRSRLWSSDLLIAMFEGTSIHELSIGDHEGRETVILRDENKADFDYDETDFTRETRTLLGRYNALLARTHIDIHTLEEPSLWVGSGKKRKRILIGQHNKFVRRVFNNSNFGEGGRFYGGWWQRCPKEMREYIFIEGSYTSEIDYSGIHLVLMYAKLGVDYWEEIGDDPYQIPAPSWWSETINLRDVAKKLLLIAINAGDETKAYLAFRNKSPNGSEEKKMTNDQLSELLEALKLKHSRIADQLASGAGIFLMNTDSEVTSKIISHFVELDVPILTIHDSYIVPMGYEYELLEVMKHAFAEVTGQPNARFEPVRGLPHEAEQLPDDYPVPVTTDRYRKSLAEFRQFHDLPDFPHWHDGAVENLHARGIWELY